MYYRGSGSTVMCCEGDGCNNGAQSLTNRKDENIPQNRMQFVLPGISDLSNIQNTGNIRLRWCKNWGFLFKNLI